MKNAIRNISPVSNNQQISQLKQSSLFQNNHQNASYENSNFFPDNNKNENENKYEIENGLLFSNIVFLLYGSFPNSGPTRQQIAELLLSGAATVVTSIEAFYDHKETRFIIPHKKQNNTRNKFKKVRNYE